MRADLALIGFILTLAGGITLLVLRRRREIGRAHV